MTQQQAPQRIQRKRTKGWQMPANTICVTRPGRYGNPYTIKAAREAGYKGTEAEVAKHCVDMFRRAWIQAIEFGKRDHHPPMPFGDPIFLGPLKGKNLACWCPLDQPCHADVLIELANAPPARTTD